MYVCMHACSAYRQFQYKVDLWLIQGRLKGGLGLVNIEFPKAAHSNMKLNLDACQNYGPYLARYYNTAPNI